MGSLRVMSGVGHWELKWRPLTEEERAAYDEGDGSEEPEFSLAEVLANARDRFEEEVDDLKGAAFAKNPETGEFDERVYDFDPEREIIVVPRIAGG